MSHESHIIQQVFCDEQTTLRLIKIHPLVFPLSKDNQITLLDETVGNTIKYIRSVLAEHSQMDLVHSCAMVKEHSDATKAAYAQHAFDHL